MSGQRRMKIESYIRDSLNYFALGARYSPLAAGNMQCECVLLSSVSTAFQWNYRFSLSWVRCEDFFVHASSLVFPRAHTAVSPRTHLYRHTLCTAKENKAATQHRDAQKKSRVQHESVSTRLNVRKKEEEEEATLIWMEAIFCVSLRFWRTRCAVCKTQQRWGQRQCGIFCNSFAGIEYGEWDMGVWRVCAMCMVYRWRLLNPPTVKNM